MSFEDKDPLELERLLNQYIVENEELGRRQDELGKQRRILQDNISTIRKVQIQRHLATIPEGQYDWKTLLAYEIMEPNYRLLQETLKAISPSHTLSQNGYNPSTDQYVIQLCFYGDSHEPLEDIAKTLEDISQYIIPTEGVGKVINILEPSLSEFHSWKLIKTEDQWELRDLRFGYRWRSDQSAHTEKNLLDMLKYLKDRFNFENED